MLDHAPPADPTPPERTRGPLSSEAGIRSRAPSDQQLGDVPGFAVAAVRFAVAQLRALRWALTAAGSTFEPEVVVDYLVGIETGLRRVLGEPPLAHVEPHTIVKEDQGCQPRQ